MSSSIIALSQDDNRDKLSGGGDLNPDISAPYEAQQRFQDLKIGISLHWGPSSLGGKEIGWSRSGVIPKDVYDQFYKDFAPTEFDAEQWCELFKRWGVRYISPTAKHHDGFALWFSKFSPYDMEEAKYKVDIMRELQKACKRNDIVLGAYYSSLDWFHPDWAPYNYGGPGELFEKQDDSPNLERYFKYMENQVSELIRDYGVEVMQFDGEWDSTYTHEVGSMLYRKFKEVNPDVLLSSRIDIGRRSEGANNHLYMDGQKYAGDFMDRERLVNHGNNVTEWFDDAWQAWVTIDKSQWGYNSTPKLMDAQGMIEDMIGVIGNNGNYMINVAPTPTGAFESNQIALMDTLGSWILDHQEAIYGTRGGPYYPFEEGVATRKGKKAWLFIVDRDAKSLSLPELSQPIKKARLYNSKTAVGYSVKDGIVTFDLPKANGEIRVIELSFAKDVEMGEKVKIKNIFEQNGATRLLEGMSYSASSECGWTPSKEVQQTLLTQKRDYPSVEYAFHTSEQVNPYIVIDLEQERKIAGMEIFNRQTGYTERAEGLKVWISLDGTSWSEVWKADGVKREWSVPFNSQNMGANVMGKVCRYIKIGVDSPEPTYLHLPRVDIYGN